MKPSERTQQLEQDGLSARVYLDERHEFELRQHNLMAALTLLLNPNWCVHELANHRLEKAGIAWRPQVGQPIEEAVGELLKEAEKAGLL